MKETRLHLDLPGHRHSIRCRMVGVERLGGDAGPITTKSLLAEMTDLAGLPNFPRRPIRASNSRPTTRGQGRPPRCSPR